MALIERIRMKRMTMKPPILLAMLALIFTLTACSELSLGDLGGAPASTLPANVLFQDDFADPTSGWDQVNEEDGITDYVDGAYRIFVNTISTDVWANPKLNFEDVRVEVDASKVGGDNDNDFGLICRYVDEKNYYFFIISSDGYYGIGKVSGGQQQLLGMESMPPSEAIRQGKASNHLRADCIGSKLSLYVNDEFLAQADDGQFASGDVGLLAGTLGSPGTDIRFDNFVVSKP
jgi:hypothetical protein